MFIRFHIVVFLIFVMAHSVVGIEKDSLERDSLNMKEVSVYDAEFSDLETQLISLDSIVDIAMNNSPYLKFDSALAEAQEINIKLTKRTMYDNITGFFNYATGNQKFNITTGGNNDTRNNFLNGYRVGINVTIPLSEFANRGLKIKQATAERDAQKYKQAQTAQELRIRVAQEYTQLIAAQKLLKIKSSGLENNRVLYQMAEKQFREGVINLEDYANVSDMTIRSEVDYEMAKANFHSAYYSFQNLVGVQITSLMRK